jgi:Na+/H+-dicarboxylate symporter
MKKTVLWIGALVVGAMLGVLGLDWLNQLMNFVATVYTRLFQLLAVPTIVLAVITTFATFGSKGSGRIFGRTLTYMLLTTFSAAAVGAVLYVLVAPGNLPVETVSNGTQPSDISSQTSYIDHIVNITPNNIVKPFLEGNVLSLLLLAFAVGFGLSRMAETSNKAVLVKFLLGLQELLFLPICTTINMNGCAAFILVTSLFVMQNGGTSLTWSTILLWMLISVVSAVGNAGVPMGCFFLTMSLMSGIGAPVAILGIILPIYTIIDMVETAENVWSDSCVCAMTNRDLTA